MRSSAFASLLLKDEANFPPTSTPEGRPWYSPLYWTDSSSTGSSFLILTSMPSNRPCWD